MLNKWILINIRVISWWLSKIRSVGSLRDESLRRVSGCEIFAVTIRFFTNGINGKILIIGEVLVIRV